eukprot:m51a1_g12590 hypothetical protein (197) ;mRNA; r:1378-3782
MVTRMTLPPFNMAHDEARTCSAALNGSCSAAVLDVLASEPFSLCFDDLLLHDIAAVRVVASGAVRVAMRCVEMSGEWKAQMEGFRVLYRTTARSRRSTPCDAFQELWVMLYGLIRVWGFTERIRRMPLVPGDVQAQAEVDAMVCVLSRSLYSAWSLRTLVVPLLIDQGDLCALSSAFPAALFAPCCMASAASSATA